MIVTDESGAGNRRRRSRAYGTLHARWAVRNLLLLSLLAAATVAVACGGSDVLTAGDAVESSAASIEPQAVLAPIGDAPAFNVVTPNHGAFDLERLEGQPVLLNFWFPSCPPCRAELPDLQSAYEAHGEEIQFLGVQLLGLDSAEDAEKFLQDLGITYPSGPDENSQMVRDFKIVGFPTTIFIDREHNIVKKHAGILSADSIESFISATVASSEETGASDS